MEVDKDLLDGEASSPGLIVSCMTSSFGEEPCRQLRSTSDDMSSQLNSLESDGPSFLPSMPTVEHPLMRNCEPAQRSRTAGGISERKEVTALALVVSYAGSSHHDDKSTLYFWTCGKGQRK